MPASIISMLQTMLINLPSPSRITLLPAMLYQNIFLLHFPAWFAARFPPPGQQTTPTSFAVLISSLNNEWKMAIATSAFFLASNLGIFQLSGTMTVRPIRSMGFLSMAFASVSVLYSVILILHLSILRNELSATLEDGGAAAGRSAEERPRAVSHLRVNDYILNNTENDRSAWWNVSILFALPVIWTSWSALNFVAVLLLLLWHMNVEAPDSPVFQNPVQTNSGGLIHAAEYMPNVAVTVVLVIGGVYLVLMIRTLRSLSLHGEASV